MDQIGSATTLLCSVRFVVSKDLAVTSVKQYPLQTSNFDAVLIPACAVKLSKDANLESGRPSPRAAVLGMEPIRDTVFVDEVVGVRCYASYGVFSLGMQIMVQLRTGENYTLGDCEPPTND